MINETDRIQKYIDVHKNLVLHDALRDLQNCEVIEIPKLLHRLKGTLGTFQFQELSKSLKNLLLSARLEKNMNNLSRVKEEAIETIQIELEKGDK